MGTSNLIVNSEQRRFELHIDGNIAVIDYRLKDGIMQLIHTEVPQALEGQGYGKAIVEKTLTYIRDQGYKLIPLCSFVAAYLQRHPEWNEILANGLK